MTALIFALLAPAAGGLPPTRVAGTSLWWALLCGWPVR